jgi:hypothetical protein
MRRPEPAGDQAQVGLDPLAERRLELVLLVADERDPVGLESALQELAGEERPVAVGALPADDLAAGNDDRRAREPNWRG